MNTRVSFYTIGCRLNQAETAVLQQSFEEQGYQVVDINQPAEVVVVNTCTVTENGDAETRKLINKIQRIHPQARIALLGCQAQIERESLLEMPNVYWIVGNSRKMEFARILQNSLNDYQPQVITPAIPRESFTQPAAGIDRQHTRANLKIQDGCDFFCSYCVIPYARGRARSRVFEDILQEAGQLAAAGHREIVLTGINIGCFAYDNKSLLEVIAALENIEGIDRIRISSIEPSTIPFELIERMRKGSKLCRYLHIPLQSGSDAVLKSMHRKYSVREYEDFIFTLHDQLPEICLGTDVIVGFPGETDRHFEVTHQLLSDLPLVYFHVFSYSERPLARSCKLEPKIPREISEQRSKILRELSAGKRRQYLENKIGSIQKVLFEQYKNGCWSGLTDTYIRVRVRSTEDLHNQLLLVRISEVEKNGVIGNLI
jgi:threonylcarbamoyladenosine tRNA methylthiotransferase MtaB